MTGKEKCNKLKEIRKDVANKIGIELNQTQCTYSGECTGTCPKCKAEEEKLNKALLTKAVAVAGISLVLSGCSVQQDGMLTGIAKSTDNKPISEEITVEKDYETLSGGVTYVEDKRR